MLQTSRKCFYLRSRRFLSMALCLRFHRTTTTATETRRRAARIPHATTKLVQLGGYICGCCGCGCCGCGGVMESCDAISVDCGYIYHHGVWFYVGAIW